VQGIAFSQKDHFARLKEGLPVDICYSIEQNKRGNRTFTQLMVKDIRV